MLSLEDSEEQDHLARRIVKEALSVRAVEDLVKVMGEKPKGTQRAKGPRAGKRVAPALDDLAGRLSDRFETRVKVDLGQKKGKIVVEFASMDDLERILGQLAPGEGRVLEHQAGTEHAPAELAGGAPPDDAAADSSEG